MRIVRFSAGEDGFERSDFQHIGDASTNQPRHRAHLQLGIELKGLTVNDLDYVDQLLAVAEHEANPGDRRLALQEAARVMDTIETARAATRPPAGRGGVLRAKLKAAAARPAPAGVVRRSPPGWHEFVSDPVTGQLHRVR